MDVMATTDLQPPTKSLAERIDENREAIREIVVRHGFLNPRLGYLDEEHVGCSYDFPEPETDAWRGKVDIIADFDPDAEDVPPWALGGVVGALSDLLQAQASIYSTNPDEDDERQERLRRAQPI